MKSHTMNFGKKPQTTRPQVASLFSSRPPVEEPAEEREVIPIVDRVSHPRPSPLDDLPTLEVPTTHRQVEAPVVANKVGGSSLMENMLRAKAARDAVSQRVVAAKAEGVAEQAGPSVMRVRTEDYLATQVARGGGPSTSHIVDPFHFEMDGADEIRQKLRDDEKLSAPTAKKEAFPLGELLRARAKLKRARQEAQEACFDADAHAQGLERVAVAAMGRLR